MGEPAKSSYNLSLKGEGISITRDVDQATARSIVEIVLGGPIASVPGSKPIERTTNQVPGTAARRLSLREFLDNSKAKRNPDKIVTIGEFLTSHEKQPDFTRDDVRLRFRAAGEGIPGNYARDFSWAVSNGWVAEDPQNPTHYYVTQKGRAAIAQGFSGEVKKHSGLKPVRRRRRGNSRGSVG